MTVHTSALQGAGTSAQPFLRLKLSESEAQDIELGINADDFERGKHTASYVVARGDGVVEGFWLGHDNSGEQLDWLQPCHTASVSLFCRHAVGAGVATCKQSPSIYLGSATVPRARLRYSVSSAAYVVSVGTSK